MKKLLSLLLALCLTAALFGAAAPAMALETENEAVFAARATGIMSGDEYGNMNLSANVSRAEFAKMMVCASNYKDSVGTSMGVSLYKDVKSDHWASQYIKLAVEEGWFQGYVDGTFRPSGSITVEEGATVVLRALGYGASDLQGAFPAAQLSKYAALGLNDGISKTQGQSLSRQDCAQLFFNLLGTKNKAGTYYGATIGYTVTNGTINYSALVNANMKGPYVAEAGGAGIPITNPSVVKNGKSITLSQIAKYDVYYYNTGIRTVWVYDDKAVGAITAISPNTAAPESVTVGGKTYALSTSEAQYAVSDVGGYKKGDTVTLMLDKSGAAAYVSGAESVSGVFYGIVTSSEKLAVTTDGSAATMYAVKVACTDGVERVFNAKSNYSDVGKLVMAKYEKGEATITPLSRRSISGKFTAAGFAGKTYADDVKIIDVYGNNSIVIYPDRLKNSSVGDDAVLYYEVNSRDEIEHLILNNATGDAAEYAYLSTISEVQNKEGDALKTTFTYLKNGVSVSATVVGGLSGNHSGGVVLNTKDGAISSVTNLKTISAASITQLQAVTSGKTYQFADGVQAYLIKDTSVQSVAIGDILDSAKYSYSVCIDDAKLGSRVRILMASEK